MLFNFVVYNLVTELPRLPKYVRCVCSCNQLPACGDQTCQKNLTSGVRKCVSLLMGFYLHLQVTVKYDTTLLTLKSYDFQIYILHGMHAKAQSDVSVNCCICDCPLCKTPLTFKNRASYIQGWRTTTHQMLHFIYFFFNRCKY